MSHFAEAHKRGHQWNLSSSSSREYLAGTFLRKTKDKSDSTLILSTITVAGQFWSSPVFCETAKNNSVSDLYAVALSHVVLKQSLVEDLIAELAEWLEKPKELSVDLSADVYEVFSISFEISKKLISSLEKPACTVTYASGSFQVGKWSFIVDQSCMRIFYDELKLAIRHLSA